LPLFCLKPRRAGISANRPVYLPIRALCAGTASALRAGSTSPSPRPIRRHLSIRAS